MRRLISRRCLHHHRIHSRAARFRAARFGSAWIRAATARERIFPAISLRAANVSEGYSLLCLRRPRIFRFTPYPLCAVWTEPPVPFLIFERPFFRAAIVKAASSSKRSNP